MSFCLLHDNIFQEKYCKLQMFAMVKERPSEEFHDHDYVNFISKEFQVSLNIGFFQFNGFSLNSRGTVRQVLSKIFSRIPSLSLEASCQ